MNPGGNSIVEIQALRAIAVLLVVLYHGGIELFSGGYVGVDVFFVISGYLITGLLLRERDRSGTIDLPRFYARRLRRLLPAAAVTVIAVVAVGWFYYSPLVFREVTSAAIATSVYLSNVWFFQISTDYLAAEPHSNPLLHTWSLSVEEQFYLFWPLLIVGLTRLARTSSAHRTMMIGLAIVSVLSLVLCVVQTYTNQPVAFFGTHARAWEFGVGGMLALAHARAVPVAIGQRNFFFLVGVTLIVVTSLGYDDRTVFPGLAAFWPVLGTACVIHSCSQGGSSVFSGWMGLKPVQYVGDVSYSFYLWHWPVVAYLDAFTAQLGALWLPSYLVISLLLASLSYHFVENPIRFSKGLSKSLANSYLLGGVVTAVALCCVGAAHWSTTQELGSPWQVAYRDAPDDNAITYSDGCHVDFLTTQIPETCVYGALDSPKSIVLFGDSHAANWFPALESMATEKGYRLYSLTKSGCPSFLDLELFNSMLGRSYTECSQWRSNALEFIETRAPNLVIIANSNIYFGDGSVSGGEGSGGKKLVRSMAATRAWVDEAEVPFVVIRDIPRVAFDPLGCLSRAAWKRQQPGTACNFPGADERNRRIFDYVATSLATSEYGAILDMTSEICPESNACSLQRDGYVLYRDVHHLTAAFSASLASRVYEQLREIKRL